MNADPRDTLARSPMTAQQVLVVAITVALNALDGFDVLSISFASPGIATEWGIDRGALGIVLSMELIGMAVGSAVLGGVADRIGRRPAILGCLAVMATGMVMATTASGLAAPVHLAHRHRAGYRRDAGGDQRRLDGVLEHPAAAPERVAHVDRLPARRGVRRYGRGAAASGQRLADGLLLRRRRHGGPDSGGVLLRSRVGPLAGPQAAGRRAARVSIARWRGSATPPSTGCRTSRRRRATGRSRTSSPRSTSRAR